MYMYFATQKMDISSPSSSTIFLIFPAPEVRSKHEIAIEPFLKCIGPLPLYSRTRASLAQCNGILYKSVFCFPIKVKVDLFSFLYITVQMLETYYKIGY